MIIAPARTWAADMGVLAFLIGIVPSGGAIFSGVASIISAIIGCRPCLFALAIAATFIATDIHRHVVDVKACKANDIAMQLKAAERDAAIQKDAAAFARQQAADIASENVELAKKVSDYEAALKLGGVSCRLTPDDVKRLRDISGG